jgi:cellobiose-specific phosphotransferase system component IIC
MNLWQAILDTLISLIPPTLVGGIFYVIMRGIFRADATERRVYQQIEAEERAKQAEAGSKTDVEAKKPAKSK